MAGFRKWSLDHKLALLGIALSFTAVIAAALITVIPALLTSGGNGGSDQSPDGRHGQVNINKNNGQVYVGGTINNYSPRVSGPGLSKNPQARIVELTGSWSEQGFVNAIIGRDTTIVALYLKSGMTVTTLHKGASAILFGFQGVPQNGDPVALVKTFQSHGFRVDEALEDNHLMSDLTGGLFPLMFNTNLTPKGYTGGFQDGVFVGSLLFWIVQRALASGPTGQDIQVIKYLISQGANCKVPLSFMKFNTSTLAGTLPYQKLLPMMQTCAK
jgi:hypothetical protein